jgi:predicted nucleic acid-binding protein
MKQYVLDSYALIAFFENEAGAQRVEEILKKMLVGKVKGYLCIVNWGEIYYITLREQGREQAESVIRQIRKFPLRLMDVDRGLTYQAAKLKGKYPLAYSDCFAASLTMKLKATLVTGDPEFKKLQDYLSIDWIDALPAE